MNATARNLKRFRDERALVSIRRDGIDDQSIQGFVVAFSGTLLLLQYIYDFHLDGRLLLRAADITAIKATATDEFQKELLVEEGDFDKIDFSCNPPISSYDVFLRSLPQNEIVILEDEAADDPVFIIGTLISVDERQVSVRYFTGAANWKKEASIIEIDRITSCQTDTNYINFYARHFSRTGVL